MSPAAAQVRRPTIKEVAKLAGVSFKTVARVVNNEPSVAPEKRQAVRRAMETLNYAPNISARQLASSRSFLIALLFDVPATYISRALPGAIQRCREAGYHLIVEEAPPGFEAEVAGRLQNLRVDGVIVTPPLSFHPPLIAALREKAIRYVLMSPDEGGPPAPTVGMNDALAARRMTERLIALGHRDIAFISGRERLASRHREAGYRAALEAAGLAPRPELVAEGDFTARGGEACGRALLQGPVRPSAIFAANDSMALGVMIAAARLGVRVPEDLSVAGFDDMPAATLVWPELTTVRQPLADMTAAAVDILLARETADPPPFVLIDFEIIERGSTTTHGDAA